MELLTVLFAVLASGAVGAGLLFLASILMTVVVTAICSSAFPRMASDRTALIASGLLPIISLVLVGIAISHIYSDQFRGPEILGIYNFGVTAFLSVTLVWPLTYKLTLRLFGLKASSAI